MQDLLQNQTAIITGGTSGIGREIAVKFAWQGARVAIFGTNIERGKEVVLEINSKTGKDTAAFYQVDVSNTTEVEVSIKEILEKFGNIDILVNNAGITRDQLLIKMTEREWDDVLAINVKSCYNTARALVRSMMKARKGKIINMSSVVGVSGNAGQVNYAASKAAVIGFTKALAKELASRNVCINCIAPGFIETKMTEALSESQKESALEQIPFRRLGSTEDVANAALFLASYLSDYITGQVLTVDGGMSI
jgi:3-oxoacyl-[acyl-carrier protein] reductase